MTELGSFSELPAEEPYAGLQRRTFDALGATVNEYRFEPGARFPVHSHPQEQITLIEEGEVELTVRDDVQILSAGDWSVVDGDVPHGIKAGEAGARIVAIIVPRRSGAGSYTVLE